MVIFTRSISQIRIEFFGLFQRACRSRAISAEENAMMTRNHDHPPCPVDVQKAKLDSAIKSAETRDAPRTVVTQSLAGAANTVLVNMPKMANMEQKVSRVRKRRFMENVPRELADIGIPDVFRYTQTETREDFLTFDSGRENPQRLIILASKADRLRLSKCKLWLADATFKICPSMFTQLWVIHGFHENRVVPLIYCLLTSKNQAAYSRALTVLLQKMEEDSP